LKFNEKTILSSEDLLDSGTFLSRKQHLAMTVTLVMMVMMIKRMKRMMMMIMRMLEMIHARQ